MHAIAMQLIDSLAASLMKIIFKLSSAWPLRQAVFNMAMHFACVKAANEGEGGEAHAMKL